LILFWVKLYLIDQLLAQIYIIMLV